MAAQVMCHPDVDYARTISNHLVEVIDVLGIEAARGALLKEMRGVIEFDGSYVNYRCASGPGWGWCHVLGTVPFAAHAQHLAPKGSTKSFHG